MDRAVGVVVGMAAGDALGSQYEFGPALADHIVPEFGVGVFGHEAGEWTDDTSMAIPILDALARGDSLADAATLGGIVEEWDTWATTAKDVGAQTRGVLGSLQGVHTEEAARAAAEAHHAQAGRSGGNGSLMRTGPVALGFLADADERALVEAAGRIARLTHWEQDNLDAVALWSLMIRHAVRAGELDPDGALAVFTDDEERRARWSALIAAAAGADPRDFRAQNGWVVRAFQGAFASVSGAPDAPEAIQRAIRGGGDTDTVAAIAGSLAGALWGASRIPQEWQRRLHGWPGYRIDDLVQRASLAAQSGAAGAPDCEDGSSPTRGTP